MKRSSVKNAYITAPEAAKILGVSAHTIYKWCAKGRLTCKERHVGGIVIRYVLVSSMKGAKDNICEFCGSKFRSAHPARARFCKAQCRIEWHLSRRRKYPFIGRPPRTREGIARKLRESLKTYSRLKHNRKSYTKFLRPS
jgi:predicted DNA-binding transcriptional regulator AlpA